MKKIQIILFGLLLIPIGSQATSGACSYHGGVNCKLKYTQLEVVCNDGWTNSSVTYSQSKECELKLNTCDYPTQTTCNVSDLEQRKSNSIGSQNAQQGRAGLIGSDFATAQDSQIENYYSSQISGCQSQNTLYQIQMDRYNECEKRNSELLRKDNELTDLMYKSLILKTEHKNIAYNIEELKNKYNPQPIVVTLTPEEIAGIDKMLSKTRTDIKPKFISDSEADSFFGSTVTKPITQSIQKTSQQKIIKAKSIESNNLIKDPNSIIQTQIPETVSTSSTYNTPLPLPTANKLKWYQKIFNWFKI